MERDYLSRLAWSARWYLPPAEAREVLEDYREILGGRPQEELVQDLGSPGAAVRRLVQPKAYRRWLAVFTVLALCVLLPAAGLLLRRYLWRLDIGWDLTPFAGAFFLLGTMLALAWSRREGVREGRALPRGAAAMLALLLAGVVWAWCMVWLVLAWSPPLSEFLERASLSPRRLVSALHWTCWAAALLGVFGAVKARTADRRWASVYLLALTKTTLSLYILGELTSMNIAGGRGWAVGCGLIAAVGLAASGAALC